MLGGNKQEFVSIPQAGRKKGFRKQIVEGKGTMGLRKNGAAKDGENRLGIAKRINTRVFERSTRIGGC